MMKNRNLLKPNAVDICFYTKDKFNPKNYFEN